jgi:AcrR family transcriptional regulator
VETRDVKLSTRQPARKPDAERTRRDILAVARQEFAAHGLSGARVDAIADKMRTTKRMIYYYFGSKEGLYLAVLEQVYSEIRDAEQTLELDSLPPETAMRRMVEFTFDHHDQNPDFVRLVGIENIHNGIHLAHSDVLRQRSARVLDSLERILQRGRAAGVFRSDIDALETHLMISAFCFYRVSNRYTFGTLFRRDLTAPAFRLKQKRMIVEAVLRMLAPAA